MSVVTLKNINLTQCFKMLDFDDSDFYIGEQQIKDQEEQSTEIEKNKNLQNCALCQTKLKCKLVKIENRRGYPLLHFEINEKNYFYRILGVKVDNTIVLQCSKTISPGSRLRCRNISTVLPSDLLEEIIENSPSISKYSKFLDKSDPRVHDLNSFDIGEGHKCSGTEI
jgi:hypothetical protein